MAVSVASSFDVAVAALASGGTDATANASTTATRCHGRIRIIAALPVVFDVLSRALPCDGRASRLRSVLIYSGARNGPARRQARDDGEWRNPYRSHRVGDVPHW
jgi:hypothetical protein